MPVGFEGGGRGHNLTHNISYEHPFPSIGWLFGWSVGWMVGRFVIISQKGRVVAFHLLHRSTCLLLH